MQDFFVFLFIVYLVLGIAFTIEGLIIKASMEGKSLNTAGKFLLVFFLPIVLPCAILIGVAILAFMVFEKIKLFEE